MCQARSAWQTVFCQEIPKRERDRIKLFFWHSWHTMYSKHCEYFWGAFIEENICIVIVKRKNGKWKCKLSFDGLGLLKYGLLFPRSFSKLSFVTEAARTAAQANCQRRKLERQFSTWKSSPLRIFKKTRWCSQNYIRGISSLRSFLCSFSSIEFRTVSMYT